MYARHQRGFTLVELLIASVLGLLILGALITQYLAHERSDALQQAQSELLGNAQFTIVTLRHAIRRAGYIGCPQLSPSLPRFNHGQNIATLLPLIGTQITQANNGIVGSSSLIITALNPHSSTLKSSMNNNENLVIEPIINPITEETTLLISDCTRFDLFNPRKITPHGTHLHLTSQQWLSQAYANQAQVGVLETLRFFIRKTPYRDRFGQAINGLYVTRASNTTLLVDHIVTMQIHYGVLNSDASQLNFYPASAINDWSHVQAVHIALLFASSTTTLATPQQFQFNGQHYSGDRQHLYLPWESDISLRAVNS